LASALNDGKRRATRDHQRDIVDLSLTTALSPADGDRVMRAGVTA
jgi:hypothetical protein